MGDVGRPGGYPISTNSAHLTLLQAIALAGSTPPSAVPSHTRLIRKKQDGAYVEMTISVAAMQKGKKPDITLEPNDIVYVPFSYLRNMGAGLAALLGSTASASIYRF